MFTQCPDCQTIFELGIEDLKAAEGQVCCGECDKVFNALASLTDLPPGAQEELRAIADVVAMHESAADNGEIVSGDLFPDDPADEDEDEDDESTWAPDDQSLAENEVAALERNRWEQKLAELGLDQTTEADNDANEEAKQSEDDSDAAAELAAPPDDAVFAHSPGEPSLDMEVELEADWLQAERAPRANWHWAVAAGIAAFALTLQSVHYWRTDLATLPSMERWLRPVYATLGSPLPENWDVSAYSVAKDTISDHPEVTGALLVNATISNNAERAQPYPLLKITLLDRWGEPIGERFFAPAEYLLNTNDAAEPIRPGATWQASVLIMDPGAGAVSYGIDACLRGANNRLVCAHGRDY